MARLASAQVPLEACAPNSASAVPAATATPRHSALVRVTHWITTLCFFALLVSGFEIVISHPRFYWGETGNVLTTPLFQLPIPASRNLVQTGYDYMLPDQNGWSRYLHFQTAWIAVLNRPALWNLRCCSPAISAKTCSRINPISHGEHVSTTIASHVRFARPSDEEAWSYNPLQRLSYLFVIFVLFPLIIWSGLAMSPPLFPRFRSPSPSLGGDAIRAHHSLLRLAGAAAFRLSPRRDDLRCRIQEPHASHDHRHRHARRRRNDHDRSLAPQTDHQWTRSHGRRSGPGRRRAPCAKIWTRPARQRWNLRPRRNV